MLILDSRFWEGETHILGGKFDSFFNFFLYFGCFTGGGGDLGFWGRGGGIPPQEIAGNNTACIVKN